MSAHVKPLLLLAALGLLLFFPLLVHPTQVLYSDHSDLLTETLPAKRFLVRSWQETGEVPLWCPYSYGGMPFIHDVKVAAFYPPHLPLYLLPEESLGAALSWLVVLHVVLAGWCMYVYALDQGLDRGAAVIAGVGCLFAGKWLLHILAAGHYVFTPLAWLPLVLLWLEQALRRGSMMRATWAGAVFGLIVLGAHPQVTCYAGCFVALWTLGPALEQAGLWDGTRAGRRMAKALGAWLGLGAWCAVVAAGVAAVELLPALEATTQATRGGGVPSGWNWGLSVLFLTNLIGGPLGAPSWEVLGGLGVLWLAAATLAPLLRGGLVRYRAAIALILLVFGLGGGAALQRLPGFGLFQLHARMLVFLAVPVSLLAATTVQATSAGVPVRPAVRGTMLAVLSGSLFLLLARMVLFKTETPRFPFYWAALLVTAPVAFWLLSRQHGTRLRWLGPLLLLIDALALIGPLVEVRPESAFHEPAECVRYVWAHAQAGERVLDRGLLDPAVTPLDPALPLILQVESLRGFNSVDVRRYKEFLQFIMDDDRPLRPREGKFGFPVLDNFPIQNKPLLDVLGVRYLLQPAEPSWHFAAAGEPGVDAAWEPVFEDARPRAYLVIAGGVQELPAYRVYQNRTVLPRAFVVSEAAPLPERDALAALKATDFRRTVLLEDHPGGRQGNSSAAAFRAVTVRESRPNHVVLDVPAGPAGYLVLADVWFPGWRCTIDGQPAPVRRANYLFRGVELPEGAKEVMFSFEPASYAVGKAISLAALLLCALAGIGPYLRSRFRRAAPGPRVPSVFD